MEKYLLEKYREMVNSLEKYREKGREICMVLIYFIVYVKHDFF